MRDNGTSAVGCQAIAVLIYAAMVQVCRAKVRCSLLAGATYGDYEIEKVSNDVVFVG